MRRILCNEGDGAGSLRLALRCAHRAHPGVEHGLTGLGLIGRRLYVPSPYRRWMYVALACGFVAFHVTHTSTVYTRNYPHQAATGVEGR
jgi:hypothetical protein